METDNKQFALIVSGILALAAIMFVLSGGEWDGNMAAENAPDLPPLAEVAR